MADRHISTDPFEWPTRRFNHMFTNLRLSDDLPSSSSVGSGAMNTTTSIGVFKNNYEEKKFTATLQGNEKTEVDLRSLEFVDAPSESLFCAICAAPFITPMELGCEHIFCEECIYEHLTCGIQSAKSCPKCRRPIESLKPCSKLLNQLLDELVAVCPNVESGCTKKLKRYTFNDHINQYCDYEEVPCPEAKCGGLIERCLAEGSCLHTYTECEVCNDYVMEKDLAYHEEHVCPDSSVECDYCDLELRRGQIKQHLKTDCPMAPTSCRGSVVGCSFSDARKTVEKHMTSCPMATMSSYIETLNHRQKQLVSENAELRTQVDSLQSRISDLEDNYAKLASSFKKEHRRSVMMETSAASALLIEEVKARMEEVNSDYNTRLDTATSENARLHMGMINEAQRTSQQFYTINGTLTALRTQLNHLMMSSRGGTNGGGNQNGGMGTSGASAGGGVSLDNTRREPPKL